MLLFICHASEDQADADKPLADELSKGYDVWYAPYVLKLGDGLRRKIAGTDSFASIRSQKQPRVRLEHLATTVLNALPGALT